MRPSLVLELRRSRIWLCICLGMPALVCLLLPASGASGSLAGLVLTGVSAATSMALRAGGWLGAPAPPAVSFGDEGWRIRFAGQSEWLPVRLRSDCLVSSRLVILRFEGIRRHPYSVLVFQDAARAESQRRLRVLLRWHPEVLPAS